MPFHLLLGLTQDKPGGLAGSALISVTSTSSSSLDPAFRRVLMYLIVGTKGGYNRGEIIKLLRNEPMNTNKISEKLSLDYKTVQHHVKLLEQNNIIIASSPKGTYGALYFLTPYMEKNIQVLEEIWGKSGRR
jgi:DNA-binding transcriptional ArsR family regulator